ncbi:MAG: hypothetical protein KIS81_09470 [Maricaulaceae bacterium]|nr:hypothetical protein [Maricaulaceae bacterium]
MVEKTAPEPAAEPAPDPAADPPAARPRKRDRAEWTVLENARLAGETPRSIAARTGLKPNYVVQKLWLLGNESPARRRARLALLRRRQLARAETELAEGDADTAARIARAIVALTAAGKSLEEFMKPDDAETRHTRSAEPAGRVSLEELRAEVERRYLGRHERRSMPDGDPGDGPGGAEPGAG